VSQLYIWEGVPNCIYLPATIKLRLLNYAALWFSLWLRPLCRGPILYPGYIEGKRADRDPTHGLSRGHRDISLRDYFPLSHVPGSVVEGVYRVGY
jgi:hypothetical protein